MRGPRDKTEQDLLIWVTACGQEVASSEGNSARFEIGCGTSWNQWWGLDVPVDECQKAAAAAARKKMALYHSPVYLGMDPRP
jgi:hypothetical protein